MAGSLNVYRPVSLSLLGEPGAENVFSIYRRAGEPCTACGTPIVRTVIAGRGTFHCPTCQPPRSR